MKSGNAFFTIAFLRTVKNLVKLFKPISNAVKGLAIKQLFAVLRIPQCGCHDILKRLL